MLPRVGPRRGEVATSLRPQQAEVSMSMRFGRLHVALSSRRLLLAWKHGDGAVVAFLVLP